MDTLASGAAFLTGRESESPRFLRRADKSAPGVLGGRCRSKRALHQRKNRAKRPRKTPSPAHPPRSPPVSRAGYLLQDTPRSQKEVLSGLRKRAGSALPPRSRLGGAERTALRSSARLLANATEGEAGTECARERSSSLRERKRSQAGAAASRRDLAPPAACRAEPQELAQKARHLPTATPTGSSEKPAAGFLARHRMRVSNKWAGIVVCLV